jgi:hypothetical protein
VPPLGTQEQAASSIPVETAKDHSTGCLACKVWYVIFNTCIKWLNRQIQSSSLVVFKLSLDRSFNNTEAVAPAPTFVWRI